MLEILIAILGIAIGGLIGITSYMLSKSKKDCCRNISLLAFGIACLIGYIILLKNL